MKDDCVITCKENLNHLFGKFNWEYTYNKNPHAGWALGRVYVSDLNLNVPKAIFYFSRVPEYAGEWLKEELMTESEHNKMVGESEFYLRTLYYKMYIDCMGRNLDYLNNSKTHERRASLMGVNNKFNLEWGKELSPELVDCPGEEISVDGKFSDKVFVLKEVSNVNNMEDADLDNMVSESR